MRLLARCWPLVEMPEGPRRTGDIDGSEVAATLYKVDLAPAEDEYLLWDEPLNGAVRRR